MTNLTDTFRQARAASKELALLPDRRVNEILQAVADTIEERTPWLLEANAQDLALMDEANPLHDRLKLTTERLADIAADMRAVSRLPSPLGRTLAEKTLPNGLRLRKVSVPFGVIGMVYEARPNVTFDVFSLCLKSGNACVLKGGKDADRSNRAAVELIHETLARFGVSPQAVTLLPATHEATAQMLTAVGYIDLCIPRGSKRLIDFVRETAKVPVIETGAGVVHAYFDEDGDLEMGKAIINNAKTRRPSVCNALDCLLVHRSRLPQLAQLCEPLTSRLRHGREDRGRHGRGHPPHRDLRQRPQRVRHHLLPGARRPLPGPRGRGLRLRQRPHQLHRRGAVRAGRGDRHQHPEAGSQRPHGTGGDHHLQVAHQRRGADTPVTPPPPTHLTLIHRL